MQHRDLIASLPKAELHLHIEGSLEPELMFDLATRNDVEIPFSSPQQIRNAYQFSNLQEFLFIYYQGMDVLLHEQDFFELTMAYMKQAHANNVRHVEIFFDPQGHTCRGVSFDTMARGILAALDEAREVLGISSHLIMSFMRHLSEQDAFDTLAQAEPWLEHIIAIGLDSSELGYPPSRFRNIFARAREMGLKLCAHGGEEGPPAYVIEALDILHIDRLDHGNRAMEDPELVKRLSETGLTLTVCPLSNLKLGIINDMAQSPVRAMLEHGLSVCINSDDPAYFGGYMNANFEAVSDALALNQNQLATLAQNGFRGSFLPEPDKARHLADIKSVLHDLTQQEP